MKRNVLTAALAVQLMAFSFPAAGYAEETQVTSVQTTIDSMPTVNPGRNVTIAGTTPLAEVVVKVLAPNGTILYFDVVLTSGGRYHTMFTLPSDALSGTYQVAVGQGSSVTSASFNAYPASNPNPTPDPTPTPDPGTDTGSTPDDSDPVIVEGDELKAENGQVSLNMSEHSEPNLEVRLPADINKLVAGSELKVELPSGTIIFPREVLDSWTGLANGNTNGTPTLRISRVASEAAAKMVESSSTSGAVMNPQGEVLQLELSMVTDGDHDLKLSTFTKPVTLTLKVGDGPNANLAGIYYVADNGSTEYVGGKIKNGMISADVMHFSTYGVFTYEKSYRDVPTSHWASPVIKELTAKHIVQGVSADSFGPELQITRAEFVAMIVRQLGLEASGQAKFSDVSADSWYASEVAAAYENGIAEGTGAATFEPNKRITREEMSAIIVRVYEKMTGQKAALGTVSFADSQEIADWAKPSVQAAVKAGLMAGRSETGFAPKGNATRAEASQVLYNLLNKQ